MLPRRPRLSLETYSIWQNEFIWAALAAVLDFFPKFRLPAQNYLGACLIRER